MKFLKNLFKKKIKVNLQDDLLGEITSTCYEEDTFVSWSFNRVFNGHSTNFFIVGTKSGVGKVEKASLIDILNKEKIVISESTRVLKEFDQEAGMEIPLVEDKFTLISISIGGAVAELTFEEKTTFYHYNILFENGKAIEVISIDS